MITLDDVAARAEEAAAVARNKAIGRQNGVLFIKILKQYDCRLMFLFQTPPHRLKLPG
jgi:hypothetical protein